MGRLDLKDGAIVYVDTTPIIYSVERHPKYIDLLQPLWTKVNNNEISLLSSELLWLEILVKPLKVNNQSIVDLYRTHLRSYSEAESRFIISLTKQRFIFVVAFFNVLS